MENDTDGPECLAKIRVCSKKNHLPFVFPWLAAMLRRQSIPAGSGLQAA
jgi:hypothetical protein